MTLAFFSMYYWNQGVNCPVDDWHLRYEKLQADTVAKNLKRSLLSVFPLIVLSLSPHISRRWGGRRQPGRSWCRLGIPADSGPPPCTNSGKKAQSFPWGLGSFTEGALGEKGGGSNSDPTSHPPRRAFHRTVCSPIIKQDHLLANQDPHHVLSKPG